MSVPPALGVQPTQAARTTIVTLSVIEGKRLLRNPVLLVGAALGVALAILPWLGGEPTQGFGSANYEQFTTLWAPLYLGAFVAANLAALRERATATAEMFRASPVAYGERTLSLLAAAVVPTAIAAVLSALQLGLIASVGGITVYGRPLMPSIIEMALVPAITATSFISGVALARVIGSRTFGVVWAALATFTLFFMYWLFAWFPASFVRPYSTALRAVDLGTAITPGERQQWNPIPPNEWHANWWAIERDVGIVGWHITYLAGVTLLLAAYAVRRSGHRRVRWMHLSGAALAVAGLTLQIVAFGFPLTSYV